jgi:hypothetical protein
VQARLEDAAQCLLVIIGATPEGKKELVGMIDGVGERATFCCDASIRSVLEVKRTCRERRERVDPTKMTRLVIRKSILL